MLRFARKSRLFLALAVFSLILCCSNSTTYSDEPDEPPQLEWTSVPYNSDLLRITGRTNYTMGDFVILSWSASAVTVAFVGTALEMEAGTNQFAYIDVFVDGEKEPSSLIKLANTGEEPIVVPVVTGLRYGTHVVTLYKRSESHNGDWLFYGLRVLGEARKDLLPKVPKHKIEFVGNSITCGCDVLNPVPGGESDLAYTSSYHSYAGQTAMTLKAEIHNICMGGRGFHINYDRSKNYLLPAIYGLTGTTSIYTVNWAPDKWHPDIVVVNLGTNDFASGANDSAGFVNAAVNFIERIRSYHPESKIVMLDGPMLTGGLMVQCRQYLDIVKATLESRGIGDLYRFSLDPRGDNPFGINFHPTQKEAAEDARKLSAWIRSKFGWK
jgi:hypothetical protein